MKMALWLKTITLGLILPAVVALSMVQSWKAVTISLLELGLAVILGIKNIVRGKQDVSQGYMFVLTIQ